MRYISDATLLSNLVGVEVATRLIKTFPSLHYIVGEASESELLAVKGVTANKVKILKAVFEIARRLYTTPCFSGLSITNPEDIATLLMAETKFLRKEVFKIILVNTKNIVIEVVDISVGSLAGTTIHPREVFLPAVKRSAASIFLVHNHPSGNPEPSSDDKETTHRLVEASKIIGIRVLDHIILGDGVYYSFVAHGLL